MLVDLMLFLGLVCAGVVGALVSLLENDFFESSDVEDFATLISSGSNASLIEVFE